MNLPEYLLSLVLARQGLENLKMLMVLEMELGMELGMELMAKKILPMQELIKELDCHYAQFYPFSCIRPLIYKVISLI